MPDWRGGDDKNDKGRKDKRPKQTPLPVILPKYPASTNESTTGSKDWRGKTKGKDRAQSQSDRSWTGAGRQTTAPTSGLKKSLIVGFLGIAIFSLFIAFVRPLFIRHQELPIVISISEAYASNGLGENPFGEQTRSQLQDVKPKHLRLVWSEEASDQFVRAVNESDNWFTNFSGTKDYSKSGKISGGGPGNNVVVYFVSCLIARVEDSKGNHSNEWVLLNKDRDPYRSMNDPFSLDSQLPFDKFLERVAKQTAAGSFAWIVLDIKPPMVVTNLGDLGFPFKELESSFKSLDPQLKDRLIVSLPCGESQESWMAPQFNSSVFAHFFWEGVASGFGTQSGIVTLDRFEQELIANVKNWVAHNKFALQTPNFLYSEATDGTKKNIRLFDMARESFSLTESASKRQDFESKFGVLNGLWERYDKLKPSLQWEPLRFAKIESQLIQMEELAEDDSKQWLNSKERVELDLANLEKGSTFDRRVSLIESKLHSQVRPCGIFSSAVTNSEAQWIEKPPFWRSEKDSELVKAELSRDDKCLQVWTVLENKARSEKEETWEGFFTRDRLKECLDYCGPVTADRNEWLEIQVLRILFDAVGSEPNSDVISKSLARTIQLFSDISQIAFEPRSELTRWTKKRLILLDQKFLDAFDLIVANRFADSIQAFERIKGNVDELKDDFAKLKDAMEIRDKTFWLTPHILAGLMRDYRYASEGAKREILKHTNVLVETLKKAIWLRDFFSGDPDATKIQLNSVPKQELQTLIENLEKKYSQIAGRAPDVETLPTSRNALRWPLLDRNLRAQFHERLTTFYAAKSRSEKPGTDISTIALHSPNEVAIEFCKGLENFNGKSLYQKLAEDDPRTSGLASLAKESAKEGSFEPNQIVTAVYNESFKTRIVANSFGQSALGSRTMEGAWPWPWDSATQFNKINTALYNHFQSERLCLARWGDGVLDARSQSKFFYQRLETEFAVAKSLLKDFAQSSPLSDQLDKRRIEFNDVASRDVKDIMVSLPAIAPIKESDVEVSLSKNQWKATATLFVPDIKTRARKAFSSSKNRSVPVVLNEAGRQVEMKIDPLLIGDSEQLRVSIRGHYRDRSIIVANAKNGEIVEFRRETIKPPTVLVTAAKSDPITLWVLLDCSNSMRFMNMHVGAKKSVTDLLAKIQERNLTESPVHVGLIVFGRKPDSKPPAGLFQCKNGNQIFETAVKQGGDIQSLVDLVKDPWLGPSGCTPLYGAIATACEKIKDGPRSRIVVVSDGSEDVQYKDEKDLEGSKNFYDFVGLEPSKNDVKRKLLEANTSLYVFQCNNLGFYQELIDARIYERSKLEEIKNSNAELQQLINEVSINRPGPKSGQLLYQDFASLRESLLESLPYSAVTVIANQKQIGSGRVGHEIQLESVSKPTEATVTVQGFGLKAETKVWLVGNEKLELKYSEVSGLTNIPFNVNQGKTEVGEFPFEMQNKGQSKNLVFANPMPDRSLKKLAVRVAISGTSKDLEQKNFTRRPEFAVAAMTPSDGLPESSRLISDFYFYQGTHYPILQFPAFTWKRDEVWLSDKVDFDIWIANQMPSAALALKRSPKNGEEGELLEHVKYSRNENRITVLIGPESSERYYVICDSASKSERQFVDGRETQVVFEIGDSSADQPVDVFVVRENDLKRAVDDGVIQHYSRKGMNFRK